MSQVEVDRGRTRKQKNRGYGITLTANLKTAKIGLMKYVHVRYLHG